MLRYLFLFCGFVLVLASDCFGESSVELTPELAKKITIAGQLPDYPGRRGSHYHLEERTTHAATDNSGNGIPKGAEAALFHRCAGFAKFNSRSHDAVIRVYDEAGQG